MILTTLFAALFSLLGRETPVASAEAWPATFPSLAIFEPSGQDFIIFLGCGLALLGMFVLGMHAVKIARETFGRKPPVDDAIAELRKQLEGLAPDAKVDQLIERIGGSASREELAKVVALLMEKERDLASQIKDVRSYAHEGMHEVRNELQTALNSATARHDDISEKIEEHSRASSRERSTSVARIHERIEATNNTLRAEFEQKLRIVHDDITQLPSRIITLLQQTGQIGRGGKA